MISLLLIITCAIALTVWLATMGKMLLVRQSLRPLGSQTRNSGTGKVDIIVPARNEERDIGTALNSLLAQQGVDLRLLVVNDHSSDSTGAIIAAIAQRDRRVQAIQNPTLRPGWFGKVNAMQSAAQRAQGDYLLFTDADVVHAPGLLQSAITELENGNYDFMTLVPRFEMRTFWENVDLPMIFSGLAMLASTSLEDPNKPDAVGGGAFMLVRRAVFENVGGFEPIRSEMVDDVALARLIKANGYKVGIRTADDRLRVEMFKTNRDAFLAPTKNILVVGGRHPWIAAPAALAALVLYTAPVLATALGLLQANAALGLTGFGTYAIQYFSFYLGRPTFDFHPLKTLAYPLAALVIVTCTARALYFYYVKGAVAWRGRVLKHTRH